ncbi:hypothetical protein CMI38_01165 [Candidatus Pacearchaeota archaeon]|jgi:regulatory protein YycH of two-component signal transduction system YycFG|nr:hypothetical protein [Candidatus Pacearchaeota archaeon]|tara:strand:- start:2319 stop:2783 length:465 start_codon:yes stop_codon:yes gene_type:complete
MIEDYPTAEISFKGYIKREYVKDLIISVASDAGLEVKVTEDIPLSTFTRNGDARKSKIVENSPLTKIIIYPKKGNDKEIVSFMKVKYNPLYGQGGFYFEVVDLTEGSVNRYLRKMDKKVNETEGIYMTQESVAEFDEGEEEDDFGEDDREDVEF